jgi:hypothetical protein
MFVTLSGQYLIERIESYATYMHFDKNSSGEYRGFFWSNLSKMDQTWSNWISHKSKNVSPKSLHFYKRDKNACLILDFFGLDLSRMDQTWSNLMKLDFSLIKKCYYKKLPLLQNG